MDSRDRGPTAGAIVPAIGTASSTAGIRSLGKYGVKPIAISSLDTPPGFASKYCAERIAVADPSVDIPAYERDLRALARRPDVRTILPFRELDVYALSRSREVLADHVGTPWPSIDTLRRVQDRRELFEAARSANVSIPRTRSFDEWTDDGADRIIKPRYTVHAPEYAPEFAEPTPVSASTRYVPGGHVPDRDELVAEMGHVPIVQDLVPSTDEYAFFALYDHGSPVATFQHRQLRGWKYAGGPSAYRESIEDPTLEAAGRRLLDELNWHGVAMVEFLRDPSTGEYKLMEVNPRFWSSLPFTVQAGVDFPVLFWLQATGRPLPSGISYEVGIGGHLLRGECLHLHSIVAEEYPPVERPSLLGTCRDIGISLIRQPRFDYLSADDPGPFVRDVANTVSSLVKRRTAASEDGTDVGSSVGVSPLHDRPPVGDGGTTRRERLD